MLVDTACKDGAAAILDNGSGVKYDGCLAGRTVSAMRARPPFG